MSRVLVIGAGGVSSVAVHKMAMNADIFSHITLASRTKSKCDAIAQSVKSRFGVDIDLLTRGAGFGYIGSTITSLIYASFTFIFFALEGAIMAQGLYLGLGIPLWAGYAISTIMVIPLVIYGMNTLAKLQVWTTPLWLIMMVLPFAYLLIKHPDAIGDFFAFGGINTATAPRRDSAAMATSALGRVSISRPTRAPCRTPTSIRPLTTLLTRRSTAS